MGEVAKDGGCGRIPIRIGVNAGSLDKRVHGCAAVRVNPGNIKEFDGRWVRSPRTAGAAGSRSPTADSLRLTDREAPPWGWIGDRFGSRRCYGRHSSNVNNETLPGAGAFRRPIRSGSPIGRRHRGDGSAIDLARGGATAGTPAGLAYGMTVGDVGGKLPTVVAPRPCNCRPCGCYRRLTVGLFGLARGSAGLAYGMTVGDVGGKLPTVVAPRPCNCRPCGC